jgi:ribosomal protein L7/L12
MQLIIDYYPDTPELTEIVKTEIRAIMKMIDMTEVPAYNTDDISDLINAVYNNEKNSAIKIVQNMLDCSLIDAKSVVEASMFANKKYNKKTDNVVKLKTENEE